MKTRSDLGPMQDTQVNTASQFLSFRLGQEEYGVDILKVQEIRRYENVTHIANAPEYMKGVVNLRGTIVPIIDMRIKMDFGTPTHDEFTVVIVLNIGRRVIGMVVDGVSDVANLSPEQIKPAPEMGAALSKGYLLGIGTIDERMLILVDINELMVSEEIGLVEQIEA